MSEIDSPDSRSAWAHMLADPMFGISWGNLAAASRAEKPFEIHAPLGIGGNAARERSARTQYIRAASEMSFPGAGGHRYPLLHGEMLSSRSIKVLVDIAEVTGLLAARDPRRKPRPVTLAFFFFPVRSPTCCRQVQNGCCWKTMND